MPFRSPPVHSTPVQSPPVRPRSRRHRRGVAWVLVAAVFAGMMAATDAQSQTPRAAAGPVIPIGRITPVPTGDPFGGGDSTSAVAAASASNPAACRTLAGHHPNVQQAWVAARRKSSELAVRWRQLACSAAKHATIDFVERYIDGSQPGTDDKAIIDALRWVHVHRGVRVNILIRKADYVGRTRYSWLPTWTVMRRELAFAHLSTCNYSCRTKSAFGNGAFLHAKYMTVSRTKWGKTAVISSSANLSPQQLQRQNQSGIYVPGNTALYHAFTARYAALLTCTNGHTCDHTHYSKGTRYDKPPVAWRNTGGGTAVSFDPQPLGSDPTQSELARLRCRKGDSVSVASLRVQRPAIMNQLNRLAKTGCAVHVLAEHARLGSSASKRQSYTERHITVHDKALWTNAHDAAGHRVREVIEGSEDLFMSDLHQSDQQLVRTTKASVWAKYKNWFIYLWHRPQISARVAAHLDPRDA